MTSREASKAAVAVVYGAWSQAWPILRTWWETDKSETAREARSVAKRIGADLELLASLTRR